MRVCGVYFVFVILLSACTNGVSHLDIALQQAKHNKAELEKVLKHFKHDSLYGAYNEAVFSMVGENGRKALRTKGFKYDRENGLNISKRFSFT